MAVLCVKNGSVGSTTKLAKKSKITRPSKSKKSAKIDEIKTTEDGVENQLCSSLVKKSDEASSEDEANSNFKAFDEKNQKISKNSLETTKITSSSLAKAIDQFHAKNGIPEIFSEIFDIKNSKSDAIVHTNTLAKKSFVDMNLSRPILKSLTEMKIIDPTPIQLECVEKSLEGSNICACATTGSGKTAAYLIPTMERLLLKPSTAAKAVRVLVILPTRELALQVSENVSIFSKNMQNITSAVITGGSSFGAQVKLINKKPDIVIATPGRLIEIMKSVESEEQNLLSNVEILILDEADRMIDESFIDQISQITSNLPAQRQNLLFTATISNEIEKIMQKCCKDFEKITLSSENEVANTLQQKFIRIRTNDVSERENALIYSIQKFRPHSCIIFVKMKKLANYYFALLKLLGLRAGELHGDMSQQYRAKTIEDFKEGTISMLVCTDIASRGLDIESVNLIVNFDMPKDSTIYVHRVGRTARAGKSGVAVSFVSESERSILLKIKKQSDKTIEKISLERPTMEIIIPQLKSAKTHLDSIIQSLKT